MNHTRYKTISELYHELDQHLIPVTHYLGPNSTIPQSAKVRLLCAKTTEYLANFPKDTPITPEFYLHLLKTLLPTNDQSPSDLNEAQEEDLWRIGYYSNLWQTDYNIACIIAFLGEDSASESNTANSFIEGIRRHINFYSEKEESPSDSPS